MNAFGRSLTVATATGLVLVLSAGCAPSRETVRNGKSAPETGAPAAEGVEVQFLAGKPETPPPLPYSAADETRGRWLTLFEVTFSPVATETPADSGEEPQ